MTVSDGYGDPRRPDRQDAIQEAMPGWRGWLHVVAAQMVEDHQDRDDLAQEGLIAMWRAVGDHNPSRDVPLGAYMRYRARLRMLDVRRGRADFGAQADRPGGSAQANSRGARTRELIREHLRRHPGARNGEVARAVGVAASTVTFHMARLGADAPAPELTSLDELVDGGLDVASAGDLLDALVSGYHEGRVLDALGVLTPAERRYVVMRFWNGLTAAELTAAFGYSPHSLWRTARARLHDALVDLVGAP